MKFLKLAIAHVMAALTAVIDWWVRMTPVERRETQQRALAVAACAAAVAVGGPLIGHRFEIQKSAEAYRANAAELAATLVASDADWRRVDMDAPPATEGVKLAGLFMNKADWRPAGKTPSLAAASGLPSQDKLIQTAGVSLDLVAGRARDVASLARLGDFDGESFMRAEKTQSELDCLAEAVYYEARSEGVRGQLAVAEVVMNRVRDSRYPNTICEVVFQGQYRQTGCQFTFTCDGSRRHKPYGLSWDRARAVALHASLGLNRAVTKEATHYHTDYVNPYWKAGLVETTVIGTHIFYRFPRTGPEWARARSALDAQQQHREALVALETEGVAPAPAAPVAATPDNFLTISTTPAQPAAEKPATVARAL